MREKKATLEVLTTTTRTIRHYKNYELPDVDLIRTSGDTVKSLEAADIAERIWQLRGAKAEEREMSYGKLLLLELLDHAKKKEKRGTK